MYLEPCQTSKMELFAKIFNGFKLFDRVLNTSPVFIYLELRQFWWQISIFLLLAVSFIFLLFSWDESFNISNFYGDHSGVWDCMNAGYFF